MAIYVVGAGGIGCTVGHCLMTFGKTVTFVDIDREKIDWGNNNGVRLDCSPIDEFIEEYPYRPARFLHLEDWKPEADDVVFLCVKCFANDAVLKTLPAGVELIPVQNGYDPQLDSRSHRYEGIASFVARCVPHRTNCTITREGDLHFGSRTGDPKHDLFFAPWFSYAPFVGVSDIRPIKATKLMYNAAISPLAAGAGLDNGELLTDPLAQELFFGLLKENYAILTGNGIPLGKVGPFHPRTVSRILRTPFLAKLMAKRFVKSLRGTYCSMAGDIGGPTELDNYTGHLLRLAGDRIPAPINRAVYDVVSRLKAPDRAVLQAIRKSISG